MNPDSLFRSGALVNLGVRDVRLVTRASIGLVKHPDD